MQDGITTASWLADGVKEIERIVAESVLRKPKIIEIPGEREGVYGIVYPGERGIEMKLAEPAWHRETLDNPDEMVAFVKDMKDRGMKPESGIVFISKDAITYGYDFEDRRNYAVCPLVKSEPWKWLEHPTNPLDQRAIIRLLRITFSGCLANDSSLISVLRNVKWKSDGAMEGIVQRGKEGLSRQIVNEAAGIAEFPDEFTCAVSTFQNAPYPVRMRVALEILPDTARFELIPFPNQLADAMRSTLEYLVEMFEDTDVPTFIGSMG